MNRWWDRYHAQAEVIFGLLGLLVLGAVIDPSLFFAGIIIFGLLYLLTRQFSGKPSATPRPAPPAEAAPAPEPQDPHWDPAFMGQLNMRQFRTLCAEYFHAKGYHSKFLPETSSGDVDIYLYKNTEAPRALGIIQCQAGINSIVEANRLRELFHVMKVEHIPLGISVTAGKFSEAALKYANGRNIQMLNGSKLEELLGRLDDADQRQIFTTLTEELADAPTCPNCGSSMHRMDLVTQGRHHFWACNNYPDCRQTLETG